MPEFYLALGSAFFAGLTTNILAMTLLMVILNFFIARDAQRYPPHEKPTRIAFHAAFFFFIIASTFSADEIRKEALAREACPIAQRILEDGREKLSSNDAQAIVEACGVSFFEEHSLTLWTQFD